MQPVSGEPSLPTSRRAEPQTCPAGCTEATGTQRAAGLHSWPRDKCRDTPRLQGVTLARPPAARRPPGPGKRPSPAYRAGVGSGEPHFPLGVETAPLTLLTGPPFSPGSQTVGQGGKRPETRALLTGRSPSAVPARAPEVPAMVLCDRSPGSGEAPLPRAPFSCPAPPFSPPLLMMPRLSSPGAAARKEGAAWQQLPHPEHRGKPAPGGRSPQHSVHPPIPPPPKKPHRSAFLT